MQGPRAIGESIKVDTRYPIYLFWDPYVSEEEVITAKNTIMEICHLAQISESLLVSLGYWRSNKSFLNGSLVPYESIEWYFRESTTRIGNEGQVQYNAEDLLGFIWKEPYRPPNHYDVIITSYDLYTADTNFVIGLAWPGLTTVISVCRFRNLTRNSRLECVKTETFHEIGHVFGLPENAPTEQNLGSHCLNKCVMRQGLYVPHDWIKFSEDRISLGKPYCKDCLSDLRERFKMD